jgi:hypothetical protein
MDKRILNLSYSSRLDLHSCPRRFQLHKLNATPDSEDSLESSVTFAYGHLVGLGIQLHLEGKTESEILWQLFLFWKPDLYADNPKQNKSFWLAVAAVQQFVSLRFNGFLSDWELVYHEDKPACELSFAVILPNGFRYRGFVDAVLRNKVDGRIMVLEVKTSSATNLNQASYKNSAQAVGYSVVLDHLFPELSSYEVMYLVYLSKAMSYEQLPFRKSYLQRALWIQELLLDCELITLYEGAGVYPMHGESCLPFFRECEYLQTCTLSTARLTKPLSAEEELELDKREAEYQIVVGVEDLIKSQLAKDL